MAEIPKRKLRVFLCHASEDERAARTLYKRLVADGVDAWLDAEKLIPGQNWELEISKAVSESDVVVICLSKKSIVKEGYIQREIRIALKSAEEKPDGEIFVVPARLDDCSVPERLRTYQWVDLFGKNGYIRLMRAFTLRAVDSPTIEPPIDEFSSNSHSPEARTQLADKNLDLSQVTEKKIRPLEGRTSRARRFLPWVALIAFLLLISSVIFYAFPRISISGDVRNISGNHIDMNNAPFQVGVSGTVLHANGLYVYLIVADKYHHYVQPGLGPNVDGNFSNLCQLGTIDAGFGQQYTIYAVVTDKQYIDFAFFEGEPYIAKSKELKITREPLPTPTATP